MVPEYFGLAARREGVCDETRLPRTRRGVGRRAAAAGAGGCASPRATRPRCVRGVRGCIVTELSSLGRLGPMLWCGLTELAGSFGFSRHKPQGAGSALAAPRWRALP